jgi:hypothetical protein
MPEDSILRTIIYSTTEIRKRNFIFYYVSFPLSDDGSKLTAKLVLPKLADDIRIILKTGPCNLFEPTLLSAGSPSRGVILWQLYTLHVLRDELMKHCR